MLVGGGCELWLEMAGPQACFGSGGGFDTVEVVM
jgi:hypothetical protein